MNRTILGILGLILLCAPGHAGAGIEDHAAHQPKRLDTVRDSKGQFVGTVGPLGLGGTTSLVNRSINGVPVGLPATLDGFVDELLTGGPGFLVVYYEAADCSGSPMIAIGTVFDPRTGQQVLFRPLLSETSSVGLGAYIAGNHAFYADPQTVVNFTAMSQKTFVDPVNDSAACTSTPPQPQTGGPVVDFDLNALNLTPPFHVSQ